MIRGQASIIQKSELKICKLCNALARPHVVIQKGEKRKRIRYRKNRKRVKWRDSETQTDRSRQTGRKRQTGR